MPTDETEALYRALDLLEDAIDGGYRSARPLPDFVQPEPMAKACAARDASTGGSPASANDSLESVAAESARCRKCRLAAGRKRSVPGEGALRPLVLIIGEGPGGEEDATGRPFVGPAGQLLD
ncbi:MAG: uracil-DNA glycosylase, partial [Spirochaetales bacterium]